MSNTPQPNASVPITDQDGKITNVWFLYLQSLERRLAALGG